MIQIIPEWFKIYQNDSKYSKIFLDTYQIRKAAPKKIIKILDFLTLIHPTVRLSCLMVLD
jgi:hypothetical protein